MFINGRGGICATNAYIVAKRKGANRNGNAYFEESSSQKETNAVEYSRFFESPESLADYLEAALEENDHVFLTSAVNDVVKAIRKNKKENNK